MRSPRWEFVGAAALGAALLGGAAAGGDEPVAAPAGALDTIPEEVRAAMARQQPLTEAASLLRWEIERGGYDGFTGLALGDDHVVLHWKGEVPVLVQKVVERAGEVAPVRVVAAPYSRLELEGATAKLRALARAQAAGAIHSVLIAVDGSGLEVGTSGPADAARQALPALAVPVSVVERAPMSPTSRLNDARPWKGGARIKNPRSGGHQCTSGFGVRNSAGSEFLLTAGHCGAVGDTFTNFRGDTIGRVTREHVDHDIMLIGTDAQGSIWDGKVGTGEFLKSVAGWDWAFHGEFLCTSGSFSGVICDHVVDIYWLAGFICGYEAYGRWECWDDLMLTNQRQGLLATRDGDSGGPVFSLSGSRVIAKGTIVGRGILDRQMVFQDFGTAWRDFSVTPLVRP
jgi:streptogrisin D